MVFGVFGRSPLVFGLVSYPPGPILESVFLWRVSVDRNLPLSELFVQSGSVSCTPDLSILLKPADPTGRVLGMGWGGKVSGAFDMFGGWF